VVICLERSADLHMAQLMPLSLTVSCFSKIQIGFTFLVPAHPGSPGKRAVKRVCVLYGLYKCTDLLLIITYYLLLIACLCICAGRQRRSAGVSQRPRVDPGGSGVVHERLPARYTAVM